MTTISAGKARRTAEANPSSFHTLRSIIYHSFQTHQKIACHFGEAGKSFPSLPACCYILVDQAARDRSGKQYPRDARARMRSSSHKIEALNLAGTVMRAEIRRLKERWLDGERRAEITLKLRLKIQRREAVFHTNARF